MAPTIRIDDEVFGALQGRATPFVDTPNDVLRRILDLGGQGNGSKILIEERPRVVEPRRRATERVYGEALPMSGYRVHILKSLRDRGGSASLHDVKDDIRGELGSQFRKHDLELTQSGAVVWENRVEWQRLEMRHDGLLKDDSARGIWELSDRGWEEAKRVS